MSYTLLMSNALSPFDRAKLMHLIEVFQFAVIDISANIETGALTPAEINDGRYVAGMATISAANCEMLLRMSPSDAKGHMPLYEQFVEQAESFAMGIQKSGFGKGGDDVGL